MSTLLDNSRKTAHSDSLQLKQGGVILAQARDGFFQGGHRNRGKKMAGFFFSGDYASAKSSNGVGVLYVRVLRCGFNSRFLLIFMAVGASAFFHRLAKGRPTRKKLFWIAA